MPCRYCVRFEVIYAKNSNCLVVSSGYSYSFVCLKAWAVNATFI